MNFLQLRCSDAAVSSKLYMEPHTYTHRERTNLGTKNIAISDEAYQMLRALKKPGESFTDVIQRMTHGSAVLELTGILSRKEAVSVEKRVREIRKQSSQRIFKTAVGLN